MLNLDKNKRYLLACSFGPDSMSLYKMLLDEGYSFDVAFVNYHLRRESVDEQAELETYCSKNKIKLYVFDSREKINKNVEAKCRQIRYQFFADTMKLNDYESVLVAHNQDDLIETYLLQKKRKNLPIFYGINEKSVINNVLIERPLLGFKKTELLNYCEKNCVPYSIDQTNLEPVYERNKIRLNVVSKMSDQERLAILNEIEDKNKELNNMFLKFESISNKIDDWLALNDIEFAYYLNWLLRQNGQVFNITYKQSKEIRDLLTSNKPNISLLLNQGKTVLIKEYGFAYIRPTEDSVAYEIIVDNPTLIDNNFFYADLLSDTSNRNITLLDYPLTIRTYHPRDQYRIKDYVVPVRRLFIDWKMPARLRQIWPIVLNSEGKIIYIPRYREDFKPDKSCNFYVKECFTLK